jgi:trk system potassium uptake protein TrkH
MISRHAKRDRGLNTAQVVVLSFLFFITVGTLLLRMPWAHQSGSSLWMDDLFMATSAVCVTGLASVDPGTTYTLFGQIILLLLVQVGGLGYMTLLTMSLVLVRQRISLRDRLNFQLTTERPGVGGLTGFILDIARFTLIVELIGFALFCLVTVPDFGWGRGLYVSFFYAIAAFNNAGFSLFPQGAIYWQAQPFALSILMGLVIIGGLGYPVNQELMRRLTQRKRRHQLDVLLFVVLVTTAILLVVPALLIFLFERGNPQTLGLLPWHLQVVNALFMAVQPRSGGFNSVPTDAMTDPSHLMTMGLMFIGGAPGGTAGGIKITTAVVLIAAVGAAIRGRNDAILLGMKRRVSDAVVRKALVVLVLSLAWIFLVTMGLALVEPIALTPLLFEAVSAVATVGLSLGITPELSNAGKLIISVAMLVGRVGVIMVMLSVFTTRHVSALKYPEEPMIVG